MELGSDQGFSYPLSNTILIPITNSTLFSALTNVNVYFWEVNYTNTHTDWRHPYLYAMAYVIQQTVVNGLADVAYRPLRIGCCNDLVCAGSVLIGGEDANFSPGHLLFMDVHRLWRNDDMCFDVCRNVDRNKHQNTGLCIKSKPC